MRRTRKAVSLDEMNLVVPWTELLSLIAPHAPRAKTGRPPFELGPVNTISGHQRRARS
jgi:IS5 family transposase